MAWTIDYTDTAMGQLRKVDKQTARRIVDYMDERIAVPEDPAKLLSWRSGCDKGKFWKIAPVPHRIARQ